MADNPHLLDKSNTISATIFVEYPHKQHTISLKRDANADLERKLSVSFMPLPIIFIYTEISSF
jgi:hypothetical protein